MLISTLDERLTAEETRISQYLQESQPRLAARFLANLDRGRQGIVQRLLQAMIRENIAGTAWRLTWLDDETLQIRSSSGQCLHAAVLRRHSLDRFDFHDPVWLIDELGAAERITHPCQLLELLRAELGDLDAAAAQRLGRFAQELENSAANYALALAGAEARSAELRAQAAGRGVQSSLDWVRSEAARDDYFSPLAFYEQCVVDGHPLHPGAKIKMGMDVDEVIRYSPEWGATPMVRLVAVARRSCRVAACTAQGPADLLYRDYPHLRPIVESCLTARGLRPEDYELIPVHPWQFDHTLPELFADFIRRGDVIPIPEVTIPTAALMSVRSLAPLQRRGAGKHHLKTPINVQTTGAIRTVSPNAAMNGPMLSQIFDEIDAREQRFQGRLVVLREPVGIYFQPVAADLAPDRTATLSKNLSVIFRDNAENYVGDDEVAMPGSALLAPSPLSDRPIVIELLDQFALRQGMSDLQSAAVEFVRRYVEVAVPGFLTLMTRYGIGLEGHLQNSVPVFQGGMPVRMLVRDLGGVRVLPARLARHGIEARFYQGSATHADDLDDLRNKVFYAFFQNHLGELLAGLVRWLGIDERELWLPVAAVCRETFRILAHDPALAESAADDEQALFQPQLALKALATMRLLGEVTRYSFSNVANPLAAADRAAGVPPPKMRLATSDCLALR